MIKTIQENKEELFNKRVGALVVKFYRFDELKVYTDRNGNVSQEIPVTRYATFLQHLGQDKFMWLTPDDIRALNSMIEESVQEFEKQNLPCLEVANNER